MTDQTDDYHFAEEYPLAPLEDDCRLLKSLLDDSLRIEVGEGLMGKLDRIKSLAMSASECQIHGASDVTEHLMHALEEELRNMPLEEAVPLIRACGQYLNLTAIAETHHRVRRSRNDQVHQTKSCDEVFQTLLTSGISPDELYTAVCKEHVEVVLTAHPTQVNRRTLQYKHTKIAALLERNDRPDLTLEEKEHLIEDLVREITSLWQTDELRRRKPTPMDEARGGLHLVEQSLPAYLRRISNSLKKATGRPLPIDATPITFGSWMGGDRDGNPNVTASVTKHVCCLARWMAADLYIREIDALRFELSMSHCNEELATLSARIMERNEALHAEQHAHAHVHPTATPGLKGHHRTSSRDDLHNFPVGMGHAGLSGGGAYSSGLAGGIGSMHTSESFPLAEFPEIEGEPNEDEVDVSAVNSAIPSPIASPAHPGGTPPPLSIPPGAGAPLASPSAAPAAKPTPPPSAKPKKGQSSVEALLNPRRSGLDPYRVVLGDVREKLLATRRRMEDLLAGVLPNDEEEHFETPEELAEPLLVCYRSLWECGAGILADGRLLDVLRRLYCFGLVLMKLDLRQESDRHSECLDTVTQYLGMGSYNEWGEDERIDFLVKELSSKRPLVPPSMPVSDNVREVLDTCRVAAQLGSHSLGAYVISMTHFASDVLAVELLQREARQMESGESGTDCPGHSLRVVPLFETLDDLDNAPGVLRRLFSVKWYISHLRETHNSHQEVMLGYSDSGKDAGRLAANWALFKSQQEIVNVCKEFGVALTLFHGRGGSVGRGGGPMYLAIQSQPPGSVEGRLRVTEQGEMVQAKFGIPAVAVRQLEIYTTATLLATLSPPQPPRDPGWCDIMEDMAKVSCTAYRNVVFEHPHFISYFRQATPEEELGNLNIGSRPARRKAGIADVGSLRAIPWIFAWTQNRLMLPAWLGLGKALHGAIEEGKLASLRAMYQEWPFFQSTLDLLEMILAKADVAIAAKYDKALVTDAATMELGDAIRGDFVECVEAVLLVTGHRKLSDSNKVLRKLIEMRQPYIIPINILQVEILRRLRNQPNNQRLRDALLITINGIAAGMRNTG